MVGGRERKDLLVKHHMTLVGGMIHHAESAHHPASNGFTTTLLSCFHACLYYCSEDGFEVRGCAEDIPDAGRVHDGVAGMGEDGGFDGCAIICGADDYGVEFGCCFGGDLGRGADVGYDLVVVGEECREESGADVAGDA